MKKVLLILTTILFIHYSAIAEAQISGFFPTKVIGGIGQILTINGSGFGDERSNNFVAFSSSEGIYMDSTTARTTKYLSWSDTKIELEMPIALSAKIQINIKGAIVNSKDTLHVQANLGYRNANPLEYIYLTNKNGQGGYTFHMHRSYWENIEIRTAIEDVFKEFRCKTGVNFILSNEPSDAVLDLGDNINLIAPDSVMGAAGFMHMLWGSCFLGNTTFYQWNTMDLHMSSKLEWYYGKGKVIEWKAKFRYVMMHELGHALCLGHVNELGQTMFPIVTNLPTNQWNQRDTITTEEQIAMSFFVDLCQKFTFNACGITPMTKIKNCEDVYGIMSVDEITQNDNQISVFPNPSNGKFKLIIPNYTLSNANLEIHNMLGEKIYEKVNFTLQNANEIDLQNLNRGVYLVILRNNEHIYSEKIIIE